MQAAVTITTMQRVGGWRHRGTRARDVTDTCSAVLTPVVVSAFGSYSRRRRVIRRNFYAATNGRLSAYVSAVTTRCIQAIAGRGITVTALVQTL